VFLLATFPTLTAPLFADVRHRSGEAEAWRMVSQLITLLAVVGLVVSAFVYALAPPLVTVLAPGFHGDKLATTVRLTRLLLITVIGIFGQLSDYAYRWFGSFLRDGAISLYYYASKFMPLSLGFLSMLIGRTLLPTLSALSASGDWAALKAEIERAFRLALFLLVPLLSALWVGRDAMLSLLLYRGAFSDADLGTASRLVLLLLPATAACAFTGLYPLGLYLVGVPEVREAVAVVVAKGRAFARSA